ncbi:MAG: ABC transporter transmembrane domain-containing protein, partial [Bacteroidota bacterium]
MRTLFIKTFHLLAPFLWKSKTSRVATSTTIGLTLADTLAHIFELWLLGYLFQHCKEFSLINTLALVALLIFFWHACITLPHLLKISFFPVLNQAARDIRLRVVTHLHQVPLQTWENYNKPEIISASTRVSQSVRDFMEALFVQILPALVTLVTSSVALLQFNRSIWYFPLLILATYIFTYGSINRFLKSRQQAWESSDQVYTAMSDSLQSTKFAQFHLAEEIRRLGQTFDTEAREWRQNNFRQYWIHIVQDTLFFLLVGGLLVHMIMLLRADLLSLAELVAIKNYMWRMHSKMKRITT